MSDPYAPIEPFAWSDDLGPAKIVHLTERRTGLRAVVVIDNVAAGPAIGGVRLSLEADTAICVRLARAMTLKNAMAGLRHGGGKSCIFAEPGLPASEKETLIRAFANAIEQLEDYIPGPDMGTDETAMSWVHDEVGRAVGLPAELGGLPLDELGATAYGVAAAVDVAAARAGLDLDGARVAIQGYGNVGRPAARFLADRGCVLVAASDSRGGVTSQRGLDLDELEEIKRRSGSVVEYCAETVDRDLVDIECEIWIPAAGPDVLRGDNADQLAAGVVVQGANIAVTSEAEAVLHKRGVVSVPDFVANAGGVICGAVEYAHGTRAQAFGLIDDTVRANTASVLDLVDHDGVPPDRAALAIARDRVERAMAVRRWT